MQERIQRGACIPSQNTPHRVWGGGVFSHNTLLFKFFSKILHPFVCEYTPIHAFVWLIDVDRRFFGAASRQKRKCVCAVCGVLVGVCAVYFSHRPSQMGTPVRDCTALDH